jgi:outer membrane lipoprotein-sorting protein
MRGDDRMTETRRFLRRPARPVSNPAHPVSAYGLTRRRALALGLAWTAALSGGMAGGASDSLAQQAPTKPARGLATSALSPEQRVMLIEVNRYFNSIRTLQGKFTQFGPDGSRSDGRFAMQRPGKIRFAYVKPSTLDVIADGVDVVVRDRKLSTQDLFPLAQTPLKFLLSDRIDLTSEANVTQVAVEPDLITLVVEQKTVFGDGQLTLLFARPTIELKQWVVTDAQRQETSVVVFDTVANQPVDASQFVIDRTRILQ